MTWDCIFSFLRDYKGYPEHLIPNQASWLFESWALELPELQSTTLGELAMFYHDIYEAPVEPEN